MTAEHYLEEHRARHREWRHSLHQQPELAFQEHKTSDFICARLAEMGIPFVRGLGGTGVVATLEGKGDGPTIGLRADIDALPIHEETNLSLPLPASGKEPRLRA